MSLDLRACLLNYLCKGKNMAEDLLINKYQNFIKKYQSFYHQLEVFLKTRIYVLQLHLYI
jgi:hypothetical protein